jgi:filamentous hemagglutinin
MTTLRHRCVPLAASGSKSYRSNRPFAHARPTQTATKSIANAGIATNTQGTIQSSGTLTIADPLAAQDAASKTLHITNTDGLIQADTSLGLSAAALSFDGQVQSSGDFAAALHGDYRTGDKPFFEAAGSVSLAFTGRITVDTDLHNNKNLSLTGSEIANNASVHAQGSLTVHATAGDISNQGTLYSGGHADIAASGNLYNEGATIDTASLRLT